MFAPVFSTGHFKESFPHSGSADFSRGYDGLGMFAFVFSTTSSLREGVLIMERTFEKVAVYAARSSAPSSSLAASSPSRWYAVVRVTEGTLALLLQFEVTPGSWN